MTPKKLPPRDLVRQLLDYDPDTGVLTWLPRPREMFASKWAFLVWNKRYVGTLAGSPSGYGYLGIHISRSPYKAHRLVWLYVYGEPVPAEVDHIDGDPTNNRIANLRAATHSQNMANAQKPQRNASGYKGVSKANQRTGFIARIMVGRKTTYLGTFATIEEAVRARQEAADRLHGEYARHD